MVALTVIAPCFNEAGNIDPLVDRTLATFDRHGIPAELLLVDDGSADATWEAIARRSRRDARVRGVQHSRNRGIEAAWHSALARAAGELICLIDADLQNRPEDVAMLYATYRDGTADLVQGVRNPEEGVRRLLLFSRALNFLLNASFGMHLRDSKSGFILSRREVLADILDHRRQYRYFQSFIGVAAGARGYRIAEVDTPFDQRLAGRSFLRRFPVLVSLRIVWELVVYRLESRGARARAPRRAAIVPAGVASSGGASSPYEP
jgi:phenylacetate-CoA ligase